VLRRWLAKSYSIGDPAQQKGRLRKRAGMPGVYSFCGVFKPDLLGLGSGCRLYTRLVSTAKRLEIVGLGSKWFCTKTGRRVRMHYMFLA